MNLDIFTEKLLAGDRRSLAKAITLAESSLPGDRVSTNDLLNRIIQNTGGSKRIGISGAPGVGKSSFIEKLGLKKISDGFKVAVLAIDPTSPISGGSILGDRTRMEQLSSNEKSFIRPSPAGATLGGVGKRTREAILFCEAAGYDLIIVETVGVGQSETVVASMVDCFTVLHLPNAGDELQGIKKGVLELADIVVVTKCDGDFQNSAKLTESQLKNALHLTRTNSDWQPSILKTSIYDKKGFDEYWEQIELFYSHHTQKGLLKFKRERQVRSWFQEEVTNQLLETFSKNTEFVAESQKLEDSVALGNIPPSLAATKLISKISLNI